MNSRKDRVYNTLTIMSAIASFLLVGLLIRKELSSTANERASTEPTVDSKWLDYASAGTKIGRADAAVSLVVFSDIECPFCRRLHQAIDSMMHVDSTGLSMTFIHSPIVGHRFALPAARAAECAREQGRFNEMLSALFTAQDSLGLLTWGTLANRAGVSDTSQLVACQSSDRKFTAIEKGQSVSALAKVTGTPTVIINGWRFPTPPPRDTISAIIERVRAKRAVY